MSLPNIHGTLTTDQLKQALHKQLNGEGRVMLDILLTKVGGEKYLEGYKKASDTALETVKEVYQLEKELA